MVKFEIGNLLDAPVDYICHQVNCQGRMGSGIAKQIRERHPEVYISYDKMCADYLWKASPLLGNIDIIQLINSEQYIVNMFAQEYYGYDGKRYTSYDAFWICLGKIKEQIPKGSKIGFPAKIGCGLGGANWEVIFRMIEQVLGEDYEVYIYMLEEEM